MSAAPVPQPDQDFQYIKLPDGSFGKFRSNADDATIKAQISKDFPDAYKKDDSSSLNSGTPYGGIAGDIGTGVVKGVGNTVHGVGSLINRIPGVGEYLSPKQGLDALENITRPKGIAQKVGYYGEQGGEFLAPGAGEEKAGILAAKYLPKLGKAAPVIGRVGAQVLDNAVINKVQGGSGKEGAIGGVIGGTLGEAGRAVAPAIAESALGITKKMRGYGKTPGAAVLDEVKGVIPSTIFKNSLEKSNALTKEMEGMAAAHPGMIDMRPAIGKVDDAIAKASGRNEGDVIGQFGKVKDALTKRAVSGIPIAADQSATNALNLKRGLRNQFVTNWNPEVHAAVPGVAKQASKAIDTGLDTALGPKFGELNQRVSSIIPVAERAESLQRGAPISQRVLHRVGAHTGALAGAGIGGVTGYKEGGLKGGVIGATAGLAIPELIASPAFQMATARALRSGIPIKPVVGGALQATHPLPRKKPSDEEDEE